MQPIELHGRTYRLPSRPTVVICADGCDPAYIEAGLAAGVLPTVARWRRDGFYALADAAMPTFTNPNNLSIVTGAPPSVHGISGNFALDRDSGAEIMMTDPDMVRGDTILGLMSQEGVAVAAITAKDKLRRMLGKGIAIGPGAKRESAFRRSRPIAARSRNTGSTASRVWSAARNRICIRPICRCSCSMLASGSSNRDAPNCFTCRCRITCSTATPRTNPKRSPFMPRSTSGWRGWRRWVAPSR